MILLKALCSRRLLKCFVQGGQGNNYFPNVLQMSTKAYVKKGKLLDAKRRVINMGPKGGMYVNTMNGPVYGNKVVYHRAAVGSKPVYAVKRHMTNVPRELRQANPLSKKPMRKMSLMM